MRYFFFFSFYLLLGGFSSHSVAQDCPANTDAVTMVSYGGGTGWFRGWTAACDARAAEPFATEEVIDPSIEKSSYVSSADGICHISYDSHHGIAHANLNPQWDFVDSSSPCTCDDDQLATTNSSGDVIACSDFANVPDQNTCSDSWDIQNGNCGTAPSDCSASGGEFGWVNGTSVCIPSDYDSGGDPTPDCAANESLVFGATGSEGDFSCVANDAPPEGCPAGTVDINGQCVTPSEPTTGCTVAGAADSDCDGTNDREDPTPRGGTGAPSDTGGTRESIDLDGNTVIESCNPLVESDCTPNAGNSGAGQCDPESSNYESCIKLSMSAMAAGSCAAAPVCSGDAISCAVLQQNFNLECSVSVTGTEACAIFSCTGNPLLCERLRLDAADNCEASKATRSAAVADMDAFGASSGLVSTDALEGRTGSGYQGVGDFETIDISADMPAEYVEQYQGSCVLSLGAELGAIGGAIALQESEICALAGNIRPFVLFSAYLFSALFIGRAVGGAL